MRINVSRLLPCIEVDKTDQGEPHQRFGNKHALAMVTYLRPASSAMATVSGRERPWRTLANLTSMGRLIPASTSTFGRLMQEMARLEGVPPIMSVRIATPSRVSTRFIASIMSHRHKYSAPIAGTNHPVDGVPRLGNDFLKFLFGEAAQGPRLVGEVLINALRS